MKETCKSMKQLIDTAYLRGFEDEGFSFVLVMDMCHYPSDERKMFYFHKAKVVKWEVSVFYPTDGPAKVMLESASGLQLIYHKNLGLSIVNTKRFTPSYRQSDVRKTEVRYEQSLKNKEIVFYQTN